jgi:glycine cleavage system H lipoate-binding protein
MVEVIMTVILVLLTFILFLLIDYFKSRGKVPVPAAAYRVPQVPLTPALVRGFSVPTNLLYHPAHTWALKESPSLVRVGMDDFASKMIGKIDSITLPQRNTWVRQGQRFATITRDGRTVDLISPIEGIVTDVNPDAIRDPEAARKSAYDGWLMTVDSPDQKTCLRNLFDGCMARLWVEEAVNRLHPALAQDGGEACDDFLTEMGSRDWEATTREFLLN